MARCESCGNEYDKSFEIRTAGGETYHFDSFECAIQRLAPRCAYCDTRVIGHGMEKEGKIYCCAHCAEHEGVTEMRDRA